MGYVFDDLTVNVFCELYKLTPSMRINEHSVWGKMPKAVSFKK
jgi:hypothetical protein